ncbi:hypothetical protein BV20DRAFT_152869 [Pilatotrama ljubarskyi]|nr:hypothetical protein BV20DRAFT_152869 [Pilatotrama ljubarskyi]
MDKLAVELLAHIFFYACTDGGHTGCSLSLVSKRLRAASRPARFYTVALFSSPAQIERFLYAYKRARSEAYDVVPRVRHLWLSYAEGNQGTPEQPPAVTQKPTSRAEFLALLHRRTQRWRCAQEGLDEQYNRVLPLLMQEVAADLYTLALTQSRWRCTNAAKCSFPRLKELTLIGGDISYLPLSGAESDAILYPSLRRLHRVLTPVCKDVDFLDWARHAPMLTHLRVSRLDFCPYRTVATLQQVISDTSNEFFPHLQMVVILPHPRPPPDSPLFVIGFEQFLLHLRQLPQIAKVPVTVLPPLVPKAPNHHGVDAPRECITMFRDQWIDRIEGGPGCWAEGQ